MSKNVMNLLAGLFVLMASAVATWLFLPALSAPYAATALPQTSLVVSIGPFQVNLMLIVLFVAAGAPFAGRAFAVGPRERAAYERADHGGEHTERVP